MGDNVIFVVDSSQSEKSLLAIVFPHVFLAEDRALKYQGCIPKIHAAFFDGAKPLGFIPINFKRHLRLPVFRAGITAAPPKMPRVDNTS
jgi:hypothetical protein